MPGLDPNAVHVVNGDSAAGTFQQAISSSLRSIVSRDILSVGPILPFTGLESWTQSRVGFWRTVVSNDSQVDLRPPQNGIWENQDRLKAARRVYLWAATGNTDQFMVAFLLELLERLGADPGKVELVEFEQAPPAGRRVMQLGELDANQMRMHPAPRQLSMDQWMSYRSAWGALTADDPGMVGAFASSNTQASSHLRQAMAHVLRRYPERASGLDFWDRQLLANIRKHGPKASRIVGHAMGENIDSGDLIADRYLMWRLLHLASPQLPRPLLSVSGDTRDIQDSNFELNDFGLQVCDGKASAWPANPIDYWAGGVHISSEANNLWFIEEGKPARA